MGRARRHEPAVTAPDARQRRRNHITTRTHAHLLATSMQSQPHHETPHHPTSTRVVPPLREPPPRPAVWARDGRPRVRPHSPLQAARGQWCAVRRVAAIRPATPASRGTPPAKRTPVRTTRRRPTFSLALPHSSAAAPPPPPSRTNQPPPPPPPPVPCSAPGAGRKLRGQLGERERGPLEPREAGAQPPMVPLSQSGKMTLKMRRKAMIRKPK